MRADDPRFQPLILRDAERIAGEVLIQVRQIVRYCRRIHRAVRQKKVAVDLTAAERRVLAALTGEPQPPKVIARAAGYASVPHVRDALASLCRKGLAENVPRLGFRRPARPGCRGGAVGPSGGDGPPLR